MDNLPCVLTRQPHGIRYLKAKLLLHNMELSLSLLSRQMIIMALKQPHILEVKKICDYQKVNLSSCVLTVPHASSAAYTIRTEGHVTWYAISVKFCELAKYILSYYGQNFV